MITLEMGNFGTSRLRSLIIVEVSRGPFVMLLKYPRRLRSDANLEHAPWISTPISIGPSSLRGVGSAHKVMRNLEHRDNVVESFHKEEV